MFTRSRPEPARFDPFLQDAELRRPYQLLFKAEWEELDHHFRTDPQAWLAASILVSHHAAIETAVFERYVEGSPSAYALSLLGGAQIRDCMPPGEDPGGRSLPKRLQDEVANRLLGAERQLLAAVRLDHLLADPWVHLLTSGRSLRVSLRELRERFENANSRAPFRPDACCEYLLGLSGRGGATDKAMFDFVRWLIDTVPAGSPATITLPMAHLEHGLGGRSRVSLDAHLRQPATMNDVTESLASYLQYTPAPGGPAELATLNAFASAMVVTDRESALLIKECYARIDNRPTWYPWARLDRAEADVAGVFCQHQRSQLETASRIVTE